MIKFDYINAEREMIKFIEKAEDEVQLRKIKAALEGSIEIAFLEKINKLQKKEALS